MALVLKISEGESPPWVRIPPLPPDFKVMKNYIVGRFWTDDDNHLAVYMYRNEVQWGSIKAADAFLQYVKEQSPDNEWQIFWITTDRDNKDEAEIILPSMDLQQVL
tara:strand:- start:25258 stop:25575 length:318 start_codon:yes stop_codon:yes gene_type:complete